MPIACLAQGHANNQGGSPLEIRLMRALIGSYADAFRAAGFTVHVLTPTTGNIASIGRRAIDLKANLLLEIHSESGPRGVFCIYPDWPAAGDTDLDVRDTLGPALASAIAEASGLSVRGNGVMSERQTGVGAGGDRLALFAATVGARATMTRLLVEHGAHSQPADLAILERPETADLIGRAAAAVIASHYGLTGGTVEEDYWDQIGEGLRVYIRQRGDSPTGPERFVHDPDRTNPDGSPQNITSHVDGVQRAYTYHHDSKRVSVRSYEPLTPPG